MARTAGILVIGNEILSGKTVDENSPFLARELRALGVDVRNISVIPDELDSIATAVRSFSAAHHYVFTTGGVGPTHDDLTMEGVARAFGCMTSRSPRLESAVRDLYPADLVAANLRMADIPANARLVGEGLIFPVVVVENVYVFPGVPEILQRKFRRICETFREAPFHLREVYLQADEGRIAAILHEVLARFPDLLLGSYPYFDNPAYSVKLTLESKDTSYLDSAHSALLEELRRVELAPVK